MKKPYVIQHRRHDIDEHPWRPYPPAGSYDTIEKANDRITQLLDEEEEGEGWEYRVMLDTGLNILVDP